MSGGDTSRPAHPVHVSRRGELPRRRQVLVAAVWGLLLGVAVGCAGPGRNNGTGSAETTSEEEAPLLLSDEPLLLGDAGSLGDAGTGEGADNSRCAVCHLNLVIEELARTHAEAGIGCAECHGASDAHIADESWASGGNGTPPDVMYRPAEINPGCLKCHPAGQLDADVHREVLEGGSDGDTCTSCHGEHRLPVRKCHWK